MAHILILFAHPALEKSRVHRRLVQAVPDLPGITFHDLYEAYPTFDIDVAREQRLLTEHDLILLQFPFFWYSTPPLVKQWEDLVLEHGWAYGSQGNALRGKRALCVVSTGGGPAAYQHEGYNRFTMRELLAPLDQTFVLCKMTFLPPYVVQGTHRLTEADIEQETARYRALLTDLHNDRIDLEAAQSHALLNTVLATRGAGVGA
ncbi:MAG TPA: NAD(P)H-dependent oxidoreductase [Roseiflexaceae bacterium]|nr:NAD(P)H-dependent oxidoreductase [Roseiflexaceae bacterium]